MPIKRLFRAAKKAVGGKPPFIKYVVFLQTDEEHCEAFYFFLPKGVKPPKFQPSGEFPRIIQFTKLRKTDEPANHESVTRRLATLERMLARDKKKKK